MTYPEHVHKRRVEALRSVIPLLELHLDLIDRVKSALGSAWESEPSPLDPAPKPKLPTPDLFCSTQCALCPEAIYCKDVTWVRLELELRHTYRLDDITRGIEVLAASGYWGAIRARAVYWELINHWDDWNRAAREDWCDEALSWLAANIPGPLKPYRVGGEREAQKVDRDEEILRLRSEGLSFHQIAKRIGCSKSTVAGLLNGKRAQRALTRSVAGT